MSQQGLEQFQRHRARLFAIAYRMLGSAADAEDAMQDVWLRWQTVDHTTVRSPVAFLTRTMTNVCLNVLQSASARREVYVGPWLPEPVLTGQGQHSPLDVVEQRDAVSFAMLALFERLSPTERAAYVLREAFGHSHREIAEILGVSEANAWQIYVRARAGIGVRPAREVDLGRWAELVVKFLAAAQEGDVAGIESMLAHDATSWADGGGVVSAARNPVHGPERIARYVAGLVARFAQGLRPMFAEAGGEPCVLALGEDGLRAAVFFELAADERIVGLRWVLNPAKLAYAAAQLSHTEGLPGQMG